MTPLGGFCYPLGLMATHTLPLVARGYFMLPRILGACLALLLLTSPAWAEIQVKTKYELGEPITPTLTDKIPDGAIIYGGWQVTAGATLEKCPCCSTWCAVWVKATGTYTVSFSGVWFTFKEVTLDGEKVKVVTAMGQVDQKAAFEVAGSDPPPPPPGERWGMIIEESSERTAKQAALYQQVRDQIKSPTVLILDKDQPGSAAPLVSQAIALKPGTLPLLVTVSSAGTVATVTALPDSLTAIKSQLGIQ